MALKEGDVKIVSDDKTVDDGETWTGIMDQKIVV